MKTASLFLLSCVSIAAIGTPQVVSADKEVENTRSRLRILLAEDETSSAALQQLRAEEPSEDLDFFQRDLAVSQSSMPHGGSVGGSKGGVTGHGGSKSTKGSKGESKSKSSKGSKGKGSSKSSKGSKGKGSSKSSKASKGKGSSKSSKGSKGKGGSSKGGSSKGVKGSKGGKGGGEYSGSSSSHRSLAERAGAMYLR
ncbi:hypothetical protein MPSEU_000530000 [Mayamaea pseudoterrestris]|nr:hypothetical protein MPSEU_000530000 [Mayamaea pseudoterrestris]